jgi:DNA-binding MarR family transcriptional regulator
VAGNARKRLKEEQPGAAKENRQSVDAEIRELTALMYAVMGRFQVIRRTFATSLGLDPAEFAVLISLHRAQTGARIKEIADSIHVAAANVTATVKSLERKGWAVKSADPLDSRAISVSLSATARTRLNRFFQTIHPVNEIWFSGIAKGDSEVVKQFLSALIDQYPSALAQARLLLRSKP